MKIKSTVFHLLAAGCGCLGLLYGMGIEGGAQLGQPVSDGEFITALVLVLVSIALMRLGFAVQDAEERASKKVHKEPRNTVKGKRKVG